MRMPKEDWPPKEPPPDPKEREPKEHQDFIDPMAARFKEAARPLQDYVLALWSATQKPSRFGIQVDGSGDELVLAGTSPRGVSQPTFATESRRFRRLFLRAG